MSTSRLTGPRARSSASPTGAARRRAEVWHAIGVSAIWLTSLVIVALWVSGGGIQTTLAGGPDALTSLSRLTGLVISLHVRRGPGRVQPDAEAVPCALFRHVVARAGHRLDRKGDTMAPA